MKKFISLISGGLDSPVASYLLMRKNFHPIFLSFLTSDDLDFSMKKKVVSIIKQLTHSANLKTKLYLINHDLNLNTLKTSCERKLTCVLCKRLMIRIAIQLGKIEGTNLIATGDILGEQASQTLDNLFAYNDLLKGVILLRPLIGFDKLEVIKINESINVFKLCSQKSAGCTFNPQFPETYAKCIEVLEEESRVDIINLVESSIKCAEILEF